MNTEFTLHDFVAMEEQIRPPTLLAKAVMRLTGHSQTLKLLEISDPDLERHKAEVRAIYHAMTPEQQDHPDAIDSSARHEIATRAGLGVVEVSRFLNRFNLTRATLERVTQRNTGPSPTQVLGLVTNDPNRRDPSFLLKPVPRRDVLLWILAPIAAAAGIFLYHWLCPTLYR
jgi:signal recognition particle GTPase